MFSIRAITNITAYPLEKDKTRIGSIDIDGVDSIIVLGGGVRKEFAIRRVCNKT